jgi:hypothetical protein
MPEYMETWWVTAQGVGLLVLLTGDPMENAPVGSLLSCGHFSKYIHYSVNIVEKVFSTLQEFQRVANIL